MKFLQNNVHYIDACIYSQEKILIFLTNFKLLKMFLVLQDLR
jgi:hypothetical protein